MKLLVVHPWCGLPDRQRLYVTLETLTGWDLRIVTTKRWRDEYGHAITPERHPDLRGELTAIPVALKGNIPLHFFLTSIAKELRAFSPDCIYIYHEPYGIATFQTCLANRREQRVPIGISSSQNILKRYPLPFRYCETQVNEWADFCITISDAVSDIMRQKGFTSPITVVPLGVDLSTVHPRDRSQTQASNPLEIGFVGRLVPEKGLDTALHALRMLPRGVARLTIVGGGSERAHLVALAADLGLTDEVKWVGAVTPSNVQGFYHGFDVLVVPSKGTRRWTEQFGRVVIEAGAAGVPVIASDSGELPRLISQIGGGWIVPEGDAPSLARQLRYLEQNRRPLQSVGMAVHKYVSENLSEMSVARRLAAAIAEAC